MAEESTEALARSQLETLYRLGILERSSDDVEQDQPRQNEDRGLNRRHEAFLAALPPPAAIHSMHTRPLPFFAEASDSSRDPSEGRSGEYYSDSNGSGLIETIERFGCGFGSGEASFEAVERKIDG
ncbi:hypothetical protein PF011_g11839 [Phytophthora fragariae]|uniref:Uncharacterized protein n=1 Tax=Phytophthora fragariae TaxID=53985 RepID=A0A6A3KPX3_9STRA|nr:hypothetical protein PF011_g11839 [Phytophthora fragariae]